MRMVCGTYVPRCAGGEISWRDTAEAAAAQAAKSGDVHRAATLRLTLHQTFTAVQIYRRAGLWREALAVAAAHVLPTDPALVELRAAYAAHAESKGLLEVAAANYLAIGRPVEAAAALARRQTAAAALGCAEIALRAGTVRVAQAWAMAPALHW